MTPCSHLQMHQPFTLRVQRRLRAIGQMQLTQDVADVRAHRALADEQLIRDFFVGQTARYQREHLHFALGELLLGGGRLAGRFNSPTNLRAIVGCSDTSPA